jgi:insulysin
MRRCSAEHYEDILVALFEYILLLKTHGIPDRIYEEIEQLSWQGFNYREKKDPADFTKSLASLMGRPIPPNRLASVWLQDKLDRDQELHYLSHLNADNFRLVEPGCGWMWLVTDAGALQNRAA